MIKVYTTGCTKCNVLIKKLQAKGIEFEIVTDIVLMQEMGIQTAPMLSVDGKLLNFTEAIEYVNGR